MRAYAPGIYPRSDALIEATRGLERGLVEPEDVDRAFESDLQALVSAQREEGLDLVADGMLRWPDLFRPLLEAADGLEPGPLTRFLDTNTFFRAPRTTSVDVEPELSQPLSEPYLPAIDAPRVVTLPSPAALARGTGLTPAALARSVLKGQLEGIDAELVVLVEPFLARDDEPDLEALSDALDELRGGPPIVLQLPFGDARRALERGLAELPVEGIGIDFWATSLADVPEGMGKLLLAGVVDARSSALEEPSALAAFASRLDERGIAEIDLVPNGDLQHVPLPIAREKLARLVAARNAVSVL